MRMPLGYFVIINKCNKSNFVRLASEINGILINDLFLALRGTTTAQTA